MKNDMAGHEYRGLHGCRNVDENIENYLFHNSSYLIDTIDTCDCCVFVGSSVCPSVCHS